MNANVEGAIDALKQAIEEAENEAEDTATRLRDGLRSAEQTLEEAEDENEKLTERVDDLTAKLATFERDREMLLGILGLTEHEFECRRASFELRGVDELTEYGGAR